MNLKTQKSKNSLETTSKGCIFLPLSSNKNVILLDEPSNNLNQEWTKSW